MRILNFGSINIDYVYRVPHIARAGETLSCRSRSVHAGGKGANQSVALAKAGTRVFHAGLVGDDGRWVVERLRRYGVDTTHIRVDPAGPTGNAVIQVDDAGENCIVLSPGTNHRLSREQIDQTLAQFGAGDVLLLQNETNDIAPLILAGRRRGMSVVFNPAPMTPAVREYPLAEVDVLIVNQTEGEELTGKRGEDDLLAALPARENVLTLGARGVRYRGAQQQFDLPGVKVQPIDTTAAGDTFIGYFLAARSQGQPIRACLDLACRAAALCCTRPGAMDAIPARGEVR